MELAGINLDSPFIAAPMAGVSSPAFRLMAKMGGASLVYTEMVSAMGLIRNLKKSWHLAKVYPEERPVGLQLFGPDPEPMAKAAAMIDPDEVDLIDINMGCPVKKVRRQGSGSALLDYPERAAEVAQAVAEATKLPVTVKLRIGYKTNSLEEVVPGLEKTGIKAVCLHGRSVVQGYSGQADWRAIKDLASSLSLPVIGNGDVTTGKKAAAMLDETGCEAVMIGRAVLGDPWIFRRAKIRLNGGEPRPTTIAERKQALFDHMELARRLGGSGHALHFVKQFMMWYTRGLPGAVSFRRQAGPTERVEDLWMISNQYFDRLEENQARLSAEAVS